MKHVIFCNNNHTHQHAQLFKYDVAPDTQVQIHGVLMAAVQLLGLKHITWGSPNWACTPKTCHSLPNWVLSLWLDSAYPDPQFSLSLFLAGS